MFTKDKRLRSIVAFWVIITLFCCVLTGCSSQEKQIPYIQGFSVYYVDVGNGDCIFINFGDGKNMIIDGGASVDNNYKNLQKVLSVYNVNKIDYLLLTHPDVDHVGNASKIVKDYTVVKAFIPNIEIKQNYPTFNAVYLDLVEQNCQIEYSSMYSKIVGEDYYLAFLSPLGEGLTANYYDEFNLLENPNDRQVNNLSPIIYLQYKGVKFVFTGDAGISQENMVVESYRAGVYDFIHGKKVSLDSVDFLKVGHHGSADSTGQTFVNLLTPKNAIVSVGGNNVYGHPSTTTFTRLQQANQDIKVFRTDVLGTISIGVNGQGLSKIYN